jgi:signal transduction histidine kinase
MVAALVQGPVVVVVSSRKDAAAALSLGAHETVRVAQSVTLRKSTMESAIARTRANSRTRTSSSAAPAALEVCPVLGVLMRAVEPRLGGPLDAAAARCTELAHELTRVVAIADGLMQRAHTDARHDELPGWFSEVKDYARATLRVEALASALQEEVQRSDAVVKLLGSLSWDDPVSETDAASLLEHLAELVQSDLPPSLACEYVKDEAPCIVNVARATLLSLASAAIEAALANILAGKSIGRVTLRATAAEGEAVIEVADNGAPSSTDLRATVLDSFIIDDRTARLRELREWTRRIGGELMVDADEAGNVISIYLPALSEPTAVPLRQVVGPRFERPNQ